MTWAGVRRALIRALIRATRTFLQASLGVVVGAPLVNADVSTLKAAFFGGVGAVVSLIQNALEDATDAPIPKG